MAGPVTCAVCQFENLEGEDNCEHCGADLRSIDIPEQAQWFGSTPLAAPLQALGVRDPLIVDAGTPAAEAISLMHARGVDCLVVTEGGGLAGIFTERDAVLKLAGRPLEGVVLGDVMTRDPVVLRRSDTVAVAIHKMAVGGFRHIPFVDGDETLGVVAARDVFRHLVSVID
jgi:CBS domain-containing protein